MASPEEIRRKVYDVLTAVQVDSGCEPPTLTPETRPLVDLPGFDSLASVDAEVRLSETLGVEVAEIPFAARGGNKQTISAIVDHIVVTYGRAIDAATKKSDVSS